MPNIEDYGQQAKDAYKEHKEDSESYVEEFQTLEERFWALMRSIED